MQFAHAQLTFSQIVVKRDPKIGQKTQVGVLMLEQPVNQITSRRLGQMASFPRLALSRGILAVSLGYNVLE